MTHLIRISLINTIILISLLGILFLTCCTPSRGEQESSTIEVAALRTFALKKDKLSSSLQVPGELQAFQQVDLYAKVSSFVKKVHVDVGSEVREGQLLATMEAPELSSQLAAAESRLKSQEALYIASKANYERLYETSKTPNTVSQNDLDQAMARKNSDLAQYEAARSTYREISDTRNYLQIKAPFNGIITARNVHPGAYVGPSGKGSEFPLFSLSEQKKLRLVVSVPEAYTSYIKDKSEVKFKVKAFPEAAFKANIVRMAGALDNRLRSERIEMNVNNNNKKLLPGMIAEVKLNFPGTDSTFIVPKSAILNSTTGQFVIRIKDRKAEWVTIQKGRESNGNIEIYGELNSGDKLVTTASEEIRNNEIALAQ